MSLKIQQKDQISETERFVQTYFEEEGSGHDWWHIHRVRNLALKISEQEKGNRFIIEMAALLHDTDDWKIKHKSTELIAKTWLQNLQVEKTEIEKILEVIDQVSFKGAGVETRASTIEAKIVQDADRLDAIGAIGIARTFAYGGNKGRLIYHPEIKPEMHSNFEDYKKTKAPTINHFYEKLLLLKDRLNTKTAQKMAKSRHRFMEDFLTRFYSEWDGKN